MIYHFRYRRRSSCRVSGWTLYRTLINRGDVVIFPHGDPHHMGREIAANVGYESEAAFNRAFKREFGQPPADTRA
jgi:hypothetical protein